MVLFSMTLSDPNPGFKVTVYLQVEYLADRLVFEAEASEGEVSQVVSPTLPFPLSLPSPFPFPPTSFPYQWEGMSDPVRGKFPGFPPTNTTLLADGARVFICTKQLL